MSESSNVFESRNVFESSDEATIEAPYGDREDADGADTVIEGWSVPALLVGGALIATAMSGLLNELSATEHPLWIVPTAGVFGVCLAVAVRSAKGLVASPN